jgi:uncharacterized RDD family membrane protein YckC
LSSGSAFCSNCGQPGYAAVAPAGMAIAVNPAVNVMPAYVYTGVAYAGFWIRFLAYLIDALVLGFCFVAIMIPLIFLTGLGSVLEKIHPGEDPGEIGSLLGVTAIFAFVGIAILGTWIYHAYLESSEWQGTVGKRALSLKVTDLEGRPVSFGRASGRHFAKIISGMIPLGIGYIIAGFTNKKQAIHDMVASCLVLRNL